MQPHYSALNLKMLGNFWTLIGVILCSFLSSETLASNLINGAGATFPYPLYAKWFSEYEKVNPEVRINYMSIGSGGGIRHLTENTVDFGASDMPMTDQMLAKAPLPVLHIPTVVGAVALTYNLAGVSNGLKLSSEVLADLFLGKIQKWDDPKILKLNPGLNIPSQPVLLIRRSDGSGTTAVFTDYLSKISVEWKTKVGAGTAVKWPAGLGGKGNEGVAGLIKQTPGSLGYVELVYAENNHLNYAALENPSHEFILPSQQSVGLAAQGFLKSIPEDFRASITHSPAKGAYPISSFTYILVHANMPQNKGQPLIAFLRWALKEGQKFAEPLHYSPLPTTLAVRAERKLSQILLK